MEALLLELIFVLRTLSYVQNTKVMLKNVFFIRFLYWKDQNFPIEILRSSLVAVAKETQLYSTFDFSLYTCNLTL